MNKKSKIISHAIKPFRRMGVEINETLWIDGTPYFSANGIEDWLEFKDGHKGVRRLVNRNPFIKDHSKVIEVIIDQEYHRDRGVNLTSLSLQKGTETSTKSKRQRATQIRLYTNHKVVCKFMLNQLFENYMLIGSLIPSCKCVYDQRSAVISKFRKCLIIFIVRHLLLHKFP
jgi:hypothetical protein